MLGNVTSSFSATGGFTGPATIGAPGTATDSAIVTTGSCTSTNQGDDDQDDNGAAISPVSARSAALATSLVPASSPGSADTTTTNTAKPDFTSRLLARGWLVS